MSTLFESNNLIKLALQANAQAKTSSYESAAQASLNLAQFADSELSNSARFGNQG